MGWLTALRIRFLSQPFSSQPFLYSHTRDSCASCSIVFQAVLLKLHMTRATRSITFLALTAVITFFFFFFLLLQTPAQKRYLNQAWSCMPVISALWRLKQEDQEINGLHSLDYIVRLCHK
jgi:hypothetical protein